MPEPIHLCIHCSSQCTGKYCAHCKTAEQRKKMDEENKLLIPNFICKVCELGCDSALIQVFSKQVEVKVVEEN